MTKTSILAGDYKGTQLITGQAGRFRPTTSRIRENIFNLISDINGKIVLDLYAGAGTLGFEALSRGAFSVTFVDKNPEVVKLLHHNSRLFEDCDISILLIDSLRFLKKQGSIFDIIFADPPYGTKNLSGLKQLAWDRLSGGGTLMIESAVRDLWREKSAVIRQYGDTQISIFKKE